MAILLHNLEIVKVSGKDAFSFLQSQFTNDLRKLQKNQIQINAFCQYQGKINAIIWLFYLEDSLCICLPSIIKQIFLRDISTYKFMADVVFEEVKHYSICGHIDEHNSSFYKLNEGLSISFSNKKNLPETGSLDYWEYQCIKRLLPEISTETMGKFTPQDLNLDLNEIGVSFSKGCYPGQEIVARMHYLGKAKRRLYYFTSSVEAIIGDKLHVDRSSSLKHSGEVIRVVKHKNRYHFLATLEVKHQKDKIYLNQDSLNFISIQNAQ